jgi:hypothetical protein
MRTTWSEYFDLEDRYAAAARAEGLSPPRARAVARQLAPKHHIRRTTTMTDPVIDRALAVADWLKNRNLDATQPNITDAFRVLDDAELHTAELRTAENNDAKSYPPPDPYARELKTLRDSAAPLSKFEAAFKAARLREMEATRRALDSETPEPPMSAEELSKFSPPNPYAGVKALRDKKTRG